MIEILRKAIKKLNLSIALSVAGLALAILAFWFDIFGFRTDRSENRATSETLEQLIERRTPRDVEFFGKSRLTDDIGRFQVFTERDEEMCSVRWVKDNDKYSMEEASDGMLLEIHHPEYDHFLGDNIDHALYDESDMRVSSSTFIDVDKCDRISAESYGVCFTVIFETIDNRSISIAQGLQIGPSNQAVEDFRSEFPNSADYRRMFQEEEEKLRSRILRDIVNYSELKAEIKAAGGSLEKGGRKYTVGTLNNSGFEFEDNRGESTTIVLNTAALAPGQDTAIFSYSVDHPDRNEIRVQPIVPNINYWQPKSGYDTYRLTIDTEGVSKAQLVLKACEELDNEARSKVRFAKVD